MNRGTFAALLIAFLILFGLSGCKTAKEVTKPDYSRQLPAGEYALRKIDPSQYPDLTLACYDLGNLSRAIDHSLSYLSKPSSKTCFPMGDISHADAVNSLKMMQLLLDQGLRGNSLKDAILARYDIYQSVGCDDMGTVLFTGYYTPIFDGSLQRTERYKYPLFKQPGDLVKGENGDILGQKTSTGLRPYPDRRHIEQSGMLAGQEIAWLSDPFEVYICHVQGSAKLRLPDGKLITMGYAANNGKEYVSVAQEMIKEGAMPSEGLSLKAMIDYFKRNPDMISRYIYRNPRFVFFRVEDGDPRGSLNEPVIAMRTIATDKSIYPRACLAFVQTILPRSIGSSVRLAPYTGFMLDQDTGGAIRAPGRCDVYMGIGDRAGEMAGQVYQEGQLYYFFLKPGLQEGYVRQP